MKSEMDCALFGNIDLPIAAFLVICTGHSRGKDPLSHMKRHKRNVCSCWLWQCNNSYPKVMTVMTWSEHMLWVQLVASNGLLFCSPRTAAEVVATAKAFEQNGDHSQAVETYLKVSTKHSDEKDVLQNAWSKVKLFAFFKMCLMFSSGKLSPCDVSCLWRSSLMCVFLSGVLPMCLSMLPDLWSMILMLL